MKTHLGASTGQKNLKEKSKQHPNTKERSMSKSQFGTFGVPNSSKGAKFPPFGLWPNGLQVMIRHTIFDLFTKGCVRIHILIIRAYFLESCGLYKQRLNLIIQNLFFLHSEIHTFQAFKLLIFSDPLSDFLLKLGFLGFKDNCINFFEP